jgi:chromosome segregation ATPase
MTDGPTQTSKSAANRVKELKEANREERHIMECREKLPRLANQLETDLHELAQSELSLSQAQEKARDAQEGLDVLGNDQGITANDYRRFFTEVLAQAQKDVTEFESIIERRKGRIEQLRKWISECRSGAERINRNENLGKLRFKLDPLGTIF